MHERKKRQRKRLRFKLKNITGILEFCRDESLGSKQTTIYIMELQVSIKCYLEKVCIKTEEKEKRKKMLLDSRQPFMNRLGNNCF